MHIVSLYRYPVKGLSAERLDSVQVHAGEGFPLDRKFALLRTQAEFDPKAPVWLAKANFLMLMVHEQLATLQTRYRDDDNTLYIRTPDAEEHAFHLNEAGARTAIEQFFHALLPAHLPQPPRLLEAAGHQFTDKAAKYVSLINLASVRALETRWGESLDPLRFRANVYIDGAEPFSELDWVGKRIKLGSVVMKVMQRNGRCAATNVDPYTGVRDRDVPGKLRADFGHKDLGVYLAVAQSGELHAGDPVSVGTPSTLARGDLTTPAASNDHLMCTACYYLFDPRALNGNWRSAQDLPETWRCPDCGSTREAVATTA
jgi:GntR family transcriptional regulator/MocR family aminotransferase